MKMVVALLSGFLIAAPALAQNEPATVGADRGPDRAPGDTRRTGDTDSQGERLVCRTMSTSSTTRMAARRICRTEAQWREISRSSRD